VSLTGWPAGVVEVGVVDAER